MWVANPVLVPKKHTDVLRTCVDFTCLNKHFPKDHFPLPRIDQIIDSMAGCERLSFLDAYSGYNQIRLKLADEVKNGVHNTIRSFLLPDNAVRVKKCRRCVSAHDAEMPCNVDRQERPSVH